MATDTITRQNTGPALATFLEAHMKVPTHAWSVGIPGAIGEFMYDAGEEMEIARSDNKLAVITPRGALGVNLDQAVQCVAFEDFSPCTRSWSQNVRFCLPEERARVTKNSVPGCLGRDVNALASGAKDDMLFDLGVGSSRIQFCIRTGDEVLVKLLQENCDRSIFDADNPVGKAVLEHSPTRVVISALARVEIETGIPTSATETETGPHTHLLPALLASNLPTHAAIPAGQVECLALYPEHPVYDKYGEQHPFHEPAYRHFQELLRQYGPVDLEPDDRIAAIKATHLDRLIQ